MPDDVEEVDDRRAALSAAWDAADKGSEVAPSEAAPAAPTAEAAPEQKTEPAPAAESADGKPRDDKGRFVPAAAPKGNAAPRATDAGAQAGVAPPPTAAAIGAPPPAAPPAPVSTDPWARPPASLKPEARDKWGSVPPAIQQEFHRRERETAVVHQKATETLRQIDPLLRTLQPYAQGLQQRGMSADQVVGNMLRTEQSLSHPDERVRASILAQALGTYRVSVEALAAAIDGTPAPRAGQSTPTIDPQQLIAQVKQAVFKDLQSQRAQSATQAASTELANFESTAEFLDEGTYGEAAVHSRKIAMAALIEGGLASDYASAYEQLCWADPKIRGIVQQREASKQAATGIQATQRAHAASSSVKSTPGGALKQSAPPDDSWRSHLEASWEKHSQ